MNNQRSFLLYLDNYELIEDLSDEEKGQWIEAVFLYKRKGTVTEFPKGSLLKAAFKVTKSQLDRDSEAWEISRARRAEAGKKGGLKRASNAKQRQAMLYEDKQDQAFQAVNVNVNGNGNVNGTVNVNDTVNGNVSVNKYSVHFETFWSIYPRKKEKAKAYKAYNARLNDGFSEDELLTAATAYAKECTDRKTEEKYIKHGATFLGPNTPFTDYLNKRENQEGQQEVKPAEKPSYYKYLGNRTPRPDDPFQ